ncbi:MAG: GNAT family N-acetyltransferase [Ignavibacteria bacterium]|nr:GNAT family N-acetyltransferase [Ignavibacteria bacterium]
MKYSIKEFKEEYLESAVELFLTNYQREKEKSILLPSEIINEPKHILNSLKPQVGNPGVAVFKKNKFVAYMQTGAKFKFKGQITAFVPEYSHSSIEENKTNLYQQMYMKLSSEWIKENINLHIIGHFANDIELKETINQLGFGAILSEQVRDFSPVNVKKNFVVYEEFNPTKLIDIEIEHNEYYPQAPIFIKKNTDRTAILENLEKHRINGDKCFVYSIKNKPSGYFIIGESAVDGEGFLLKKTNTAQIKAAYVKPAERRKGIGECLLQCAINWAEKNGFERLFVEHETANYYGGNFWRKHFKPYLYFSMRYIDSVK